MGMCKPSGRKFTKIGKTGELKSTGIPNTRIDLFDENWILIQQRWYGPDSWVIHNRDYNHEFPRPHDYYWVWDDKKGPQSGKEHSNFDDNFC